MVNIPQIAEGEICAAFHADGVYLKSLLVTSETMQRPIELSSVWTSPTVSL